MKPESDPADPDNVAVGQLGHLVDPGVVDPGAIQPEIAEQPAAVLEVHAGVKAAGLVLVRQDDGVVPAAADRDGPIRGQLDLIGAGVAVENSQSSAHRGMGRAVGWW